MKEKVSDVDEIESAENLWKAGNDRSVPSRVIIKFEERGSHQLVVPWYGEECLLGQLDEKQSLVFLGPRAVGRDVGILRCLKVGPPPVGGHVLNGPLGLHSVFSAKGGIHDPQHSLRLILTGIQLSTWQLEERGTGGARACVCVCVCVCVYVCVYVCIGRI